MADKPAAHVKVLMARNGWGRNQAEKYASLLRVDETLAIEKVSLEPEHALAARQVFDAIEDAVRKRQAAKQQQRAIDAKRKPPK